MRGSDDVTALRGLHVLQPVDEVICELQRDLLGGATARIPVERLSRAGDVGTRMNHGHTQRGERDSSQWVHPA
jgi:hypothetical protein